MIDPPGYQPPEKLTTRATVVAVERRKPGAYQLTRLETIDESGALAATQEHVGAHIDMNVRRMTPFPDDIARRFDQLVHEQNKVGWDPPLCGAMNP